MSNKITSILPISGSLTVSGSILSSGNIDATGYTITASAFSGSITSASYAGTSSLLLGSIVSASYALTSSYAITAQNVLGSITSASFATVAYTASYATASWTGSNTALNAIGAVTASQGFSGSIASASFASSSYTTLTASAANSLTFTVVSASYATNAGTAQNANYAPAGFTITGTLAVSGNANHTGYAVTASTFSGSIASASFASSSYTTLSSSYALTASFALNGGGGATTSASYATNAGTAQNANYAPNGFTITGSLLVSGNTNATGYAITASTFSGSIASASFASSSYTTLTASAANSLTFTVVSASYATNAGNANNASFAPNGFTVTGSLLISGNTNATGYAVTASAFSGSIASASFASSSYTTLTASAANSLTFVPASASYASTASYATPVFITSGTLGVTGSIQLNSAIATASLQLLSNASPTFISGAYIELFDAVTNGDANKGNVNIFAGLPQAAIASGSTQAGINFYTSGNLQWRIDTAGNLSGLGTTTTVSASALSGSGANVTGVISSSYGATSSYASNGFTITGSLLISGNTNATGYAITASAFSGSIQSASFASSSYTTLTSSFAVTSSYAVTMSFVTQSTVFSASAGSPNFFANSITASVGLQTILINSPSNTINITSSLNVSGNINDTGYNITASALNLTSGALFNVISNPPTPAIGTYEVWARKISGRTMLKGQGPAGVDIVYQPALFGNQIAVISAGSSAGSGSTSLNKPNAIGCSTEQSGTLTAINNDLDTIGFMANISGAMVIANTTSSCGVTTRDRQVIPGFNGSTGNGYFFNARLNFPDSSASYAGNLTQGIRVFVGLSATRLGTICTSGTLGQNQTPYYPTVSSSLAGFFFSNVTGFGNTWQFAVSTGVTSSIINTNVLFTTQSVYDFYIFSAPSGSMSGSTVPSWRIDVFSTGSQVTTEGGPFGLQGPSTSQSLYAGAWMTAFQSTPRTFNYQRIYLESDR